MSRQASPEQTNAPGKEPAVSGGSRHAFGLVALSVAAGLVVGYFVGARTTIRPAMEAATTLRRTDAEAGAARERDLARLVDEMRDLRAQIEQIRHATETSRTVERLRALEAARAATMGGSRAPQWADSSVVARLGRIEERLGLLDSVDATPTGSIGMGGKTRGFTHAPALYNHPSRP